MRRAPGAGAASALTMRQLIAAAVVFVLIFVLGFRMGSSREDRDGVASAQAHVANDKADRLRRLSQQCHQDLTGRRGARPRGNASREVDQLEHDVADLQAREGRLHEERTRTDGLVKDCEEEFEHQKRTWDEDDSVMMQNISDLNRDIHQLWLQVNVLQSSRGMRGNLLRLMLDKHRRKNMQLRQKLGVPLPSNSSIAAYDALVYEDNKRYIESDENITQQYFFQQVRQQEIVSTVQRFVFNPAVDDDIFIPTYDNLGPVPRPTYFGRVGTGPVVKGTFFQAGQDRETMVGVEVQSSAQAIKRMYSVALCAFRNNMSNLTHPDAYLLYRQSNGSSALSVLIDTPLISFCIKCRDMRYSRLFRQACAGDTVEESYGSRDFWAVRSMIRYQPYLIEGAKRHIASLQLPATATTLAISFKRSPRLKRRCVHLGRGLPFSHYLWLKGMYNDTSFLEASAGDVQRQCFPGIDDLQKAVEQISRTQSVSFSAIFVAVDAGDDEVTASLFDSMRLADGRAVKVVLLRPTTAEQDVVEMLMSASASHILVNRFSDHSQVLTEMFLLRHQFKPDNIHFF